MLRFSIWFHFGWKFEDRKTKKKIKSFIPQVFGIFVRPEKTADDVIGTHLASYGCRKAVEPQMLVVCQRENNRHSETIESLCDCLETMNFEKKTTCWWRVGRWCPASSHDVKADTARKRRLTMDVRKRHTRSRSGRVTHVKKLIKRSQVRALVPWSDEGTTATRPRINTLAKSQAA